jgi:hypothetical protein
MRNSHPDRALPPSEAPCLAGKLHIARNSDFILGKLVVGLGKLAIMSTQAVLRRAISHGAIFLGHLPMPYSFRLVVH